MEIIADNSMELWKKALLYLMKEGVAYSDSNKRVCKEGLRLHLVLTNFEDVPPGLVIANSHFKYSGKKTIH